MLAELLNDLSPGRPGSAGQCGEMCLRRWKKHLFISSSIFWEIRKWIQREGMWVEVTGPSHRSPSTKPTIYDLLISLLFAALKVPTTFALLSPSARAQWS